MSWIEFKDASPLIDMQADKVLTRLWNESRLIDAQLIWDITRVVDNYKTIIEQLLSK